MKRMRKLCRLFATVLLLLTGCSLQKEEPSYTVYYTNVAGTRLMEVNYDPLAQTFDEMMRELIGQLASAPNGYSSALPSSVKYNGYERGIDALRIDFSKEYYNLKNTEEVLLRAAVVKTISQIPGVTKVMITVEKEPLRDEDGNQVPSMDANTFIDTKEGGINSYLYTTLELYFADAEGKLLELEKRELHYSSNMVLERVVVEQLLKGPDTSGLKAIGVNTSQIQNIYVQNGVCTINFSADFNKSAEDAVEPETAIYAIVNSLCATCDHITGVQIEINGESDMMFRDKVDLNQIFKQNSKWIHANEIETETVETKAAEAKVRVDQISVTEKGTGQTSVQEQTTEFPADTVQETMEEELPAGNSVVGVEPSLAEG